MYWDTVWIVARTLLSAQSVRIEINEIEVGCSRLCNFIFTQNVLLGIDNCTTDAATWNVDDSDTSCIGIGLQKKAPRTRWVLSPKPNAQLPEMPPSVCNSTGRYGEILCWNMCDKLPLVAVFGLGCSLTLTPYTTIAVGGFWRICYCSVTMLREWGLNSCRQIQPMYAPDLKSITSLDDSWTMI